MCFFFFCLNLNSNLNGTCLMMTEFIVLCDSSDDKMSAYYCLAAIPLKSLRLNCPPTVNNTIEFEEYLSLIIMRLINKHCARRVSNENIKTTMRTKFKKCINIDFFNTKYQFSIIIFIKC